MNNKRGGFGAKLVLVLILMLASAVGGGYAYRVLDGKMAVREATKYVDTIKVSDYDQEDGIIVQGYIDETKQSLETAKTRKEVYDILDNFKGEMSEVMTSTEKELAEARRNKNNNHDNGYNNNNSNNYNNNNDNGYNNNNNNSNNYNNDDQSNNGSGGGLFGSGDEEEEDDSSGGIF